MKSFLKLATISLLTSQCFGNAAVKNNAKNTGTLATVYTECKKPGQFVLTFDDGPNAGTTERALNVLKKNGIIGTFFVNSANYVDLVNSVEARNIVKRAYEEGHDIGSHTYQHKDLFLAMEEGSLEINVDKNNEVISSIIGRTPVFFRPPLGNGGFTKEYCTAMNIPYDMRTEQVRQYLGERGMKVIMWNADTQDWNNKGNVQNSINELAKSLNAIGKSPQNSSFITLIHDVHDYSVDVILQQVIDYVKQNGYQIVSLAECIGEAPYLDGYNPNQSTANQSTNTGATTGTMPTVNSNINTEPGMNMNVGNTNTATSTLNSNSSLGKPIDLESASIKNFINSIFTVIFLALLNTLLY
ncbi:glycoside hydrolase/deacetylase [Piromyces finnis]|uniref:Glycoside hydrolase/deacetylase n=1 Tax=Piromyces finnis TaxID=1754191 RepID=A0A1Y1VN99_9FUNG|nr:glycoside hydrolase/deacetylase [Piromyces finnis]|eukprot:ORX60750.1 glycoside hydrolase/deacetylase [Piromyces finnis]